MSTGIDTSGITPATLVVAGVGGALIATWIHAGWISAIIGAVAAIALVVAGGQK